MKLATFRSSSTSRIRMDALSILAQRDARRAVSRHLESSLGSEPGALSKDFEYQYLSACGVVLWHGHKVALSFGHQTRCPPHGACGNVCEQLVTIWAGLLINIDRAVASSIDALSGPIISDVVNAFSDREGSNLLARLSIEYRNLGSAAGNEQTMVRLIEGHGDVVLA